MGTLIDMVGLRFSRLLVQHKSERHSPAGALWVCLCDCGRQTTVAAGKLRSGKIVSCGCYRAENKPNYKHGQANKTLAYRTWKEMHQRCENPNATQYKWYGARGIKVCERWSSFDNFFADMGERQKGMSIDRIDPEKGYEPSNCRWATYKQQAETNRGLFKKGMTPWNKRTLSAS